MKIFISWSGKHSHEVALALKDWLPDMFTGIQIFVSSESIRKGKRWAFEIAKELDTTNFGIACLTSGNLDAEWLLFETGALSKSVKESSLSTLLLGKLRPSDITGPLSQFQHTHFEKEDFFKLVKSINEELTGDGKRDEPRLRKVFEKFWDELETRVNEALNTKIEAKQERDPNDMLRELLEMTNHIARNLPTRKRSYEDYFISPRWEMDINDKLWSMVIDRLGPKVTPEAKALLARASGQFSDNTLSLWFHPKYEDDLVRNLKDETTMSILRGVLNEIGIGTNCKIQLCMIPPKPPSFPVSGS